MPSSMTWKEASGKDGLTDLPYEGVVEGYFDTDLLSAELRQKFTEYKGIVQKATLTDEDFARASELETYLDEVPDYLALDFRKNIVASSWN